MNEQTDAGASPVQREVRQMDDAQLLQWLCDQLEWDGHGYWLPEVCIRERGWGQESCPRPTMDEFRAALFKRVRAA